MNQALCRTSSQHNSSQGVLFFVMQARIKLLAMLYPQCFTQTLIRLWLTSVICQLCQIGAAMHSGSKSKKIGYQKRMIVQLLSDGNAVLCCKTKHALAWKKISERPLTYLKKGTGISSRICCGPPGFRMSCSFPGGIGRPKRFNSFCFWNFN
jgi:hypothetical protein